MSDNVKKIIYLLRALMIPAGIFSVTVTYVRNFTGTPDSSLRFAAAALYTLAYFTIQSNLFVLVWNITGVLGPLRGKDPGSRHPFLHGACTLYITITCIVFTLFIAPYYEPEGIMVVSNLLLHYIIPLVFILDWIVTAPPGSLRPRYVFLWLFYPLAYLAGALTFARFTGIYVYQFINLEELGLPRFLVNIAGLAGAFTLLGFIFYGADRLKSAAVSSFSHSS